MNSEELEQSLRIEFESFLKQISADMQQEAAAFQEKIDAEFARHKYQLTEFFQDFSVRILSQRELDAGFRDSVVEHLRLARDEGATITALAIGEAEKMQQEAAANAPRPAGIDELRDGISDISAQTSQATILKALVEHAGQFTPRGAFFILKNEHFVGWRVFGGEQFSDDQAVREIFFPVAADSTLGASVNTLGVVESSFGTHADDSIYLDKLELGEPDRIIAIPLVARGRGVAVLYADRGTKGEEVNVGALETLVRVAGMTVEILAASSGKSPVARPVSRPAKAEKQEEAAEKPVDTASVAQISEETASETTAAPVSDVSYEAETATAPAISDAAPVVETVETVGQPQYQDVAEEEATPVETTEPESESVQTDFNYGNYSIEDYTVEEVETVETTPVEADDFQPIYDDARTDSESYAWNRTAETRGDFAESFEAKTDVPANAEASQPAPQESDYFTAAPDEYQFESAQSFETNSNLSQESSPAFETAAFEPASFEAAREYSPVKEDFSSFDSRSGAAAESFSAKPTVEVATEPVATVAKPARSRFSDRNVDLPIEVTEDERRLHNDARRFARLLVSEIKLYNEQKVKEGRGGNDLYERLREAIDRSREMYDKRIQPPVAAKFDYFHYEVVSTLAEGDEAKLGDGYPGATV